MIDYFSAPLAAPDGLEWSVCTDHQTGRTWYHLVDRARPKGPSVGDLVALARAQLTVPAPGVRTAPPRSGRMLVGVRTWFWVDDVAPEPVTAAIPGLSATLTATRLDATFSFADGRRLRCAGGGTPWDPSKPASAQPHDCTKVFQVRGDERVDVTVRWSLRWTASDGQAGTLPPVERTESVVLHLEEGQATTD